MKIQDNNLIILTEKEVWSLCKPGEEQETCIWLMASPDGMECSYYNRPTALEDRWSKGLTVAKRDGCEEVKELNKKIAEIEIESRTKIEMLKEEIEDNQRIIKEKEQKEKQIVQMLNAQFKELLYLKPETIETARDVESVIKTAIELGDNPNRIKDSLVQAGYKKEDSQAKEPC